jgi:Periplasmic binding protein
MVITPSRAYVNRATKWLFQWCRHPLAGANRAFTKRWQVERPGKFPSMSQAGVYSAVTHYLKTVDALKSDADGKAVIAKMKELPTDDPLFGKGYACFFRKYHELPH